MKNNKVNQRALTALVATLLATPVVAEPISDEAALQLLQRMNEMERELSSLRGENEQLRNDLEEMQRNQKDGFLQVDERIEKLNLEQSMGTMPETDNPADKPADEASSAETDKTDTGPSSDMPANADSKAENKPEKADPNGFYSYGTGKLDDKNADVTKAREETANDKAVDENKDDAKVADDGKTVDQPASPREERSVYDEAFKTLLKDPKAAIPAFRGFLKDYPDSPLAASAQYWVGEALYAEKDFQAAADELLIVLKDYKDSDKAPDAALKLGYSFYELKEWDKARKTLEDVVKFFPDSDAAKLAAERLDKMKAEGH